MILKGNRLVIPTNLVQKAVDLAHASHQGIVKTKKLIREKVWFPGIDKTVEDKVKSCLPCQAAVNEGAEKPEPLNMTPLPHGPWQDVSADFLGPLPTGEYILVVIDDYSRFPEVEIVSGTSSRTTIPALDGIFARQGVPMTLRTDNGPPFSGHEFKEFADHLGFTHRKVTPYWPRANGAVERFNRALVKVIRTAHTERRSWKQQLFRFLRAYRATPHSTTNLSPSQALNSRDMKCELPQVTLPSGASDSQNDMKDRDDAQKKKMKDNADKVLHSRESGVKRGDMVLVRQRKTSKVSSPFDPRPLIVVSRKGNSVTAKRGNYYVRRNVSFFKRVSVEMNAKDDFNDLADPDVDDIEVEEDDDDPACDVNRQPRPILRDPVRRSGRRCGMPVRFQDFVLYSS